MVEHFGGALDVLEAPMHGKPSPVMLKTGGGKCLRGLQSPFIAARYFFSFHDAVSTDARIVQFCFLVLVAAYFTVAHY